MARKETVNTFTDGMVKDLNPLNTPNTVLTDCLNGTLITYDGNEFTLQNDKGNYPLSKCKLPENYIPVGVKEYGDILYIVSYNPIDRKVQVGSYPSPQTIYNSTTEKTRKYDEINANDGGTQNITSIWPSSNTEINYQELISNNENLKIFCGSKPEIWKINPGDLYRLEENEIFSLNDYEEIEFYIMDDDKKLHKLKTNDEIKISDNFQHVKWNVPGFLTTKIHIAEIDDFNVNTRKIKVKKYENISGSTNALEELRLNFQILVSDHLINDNITNIVNNNDLMVRIKYDDWNTDLDLPINGYIDKGNGKICYYVNWEANLSGNNYSVVANANDTLTFTIIPILKGRSGNNPSGGTIIFDNFKKELQFDLSSKGNVNDFTIGDGIWKWNVDDNLTLRFDTSGVQENSVFDQDLFVKCSIRRLSNINENNIHTYTVVSDGNNIPLNEVSLESLGCEWNVHGITELVLPFKSFPTSENDYNQNKDFLYAEDCYEVEFNFYESLESGATAMREPIKKFLLATKLLNDNSSNRYDQVTFDQWFTNYSNYVNNKFFQVTGEIDYQNATVECLEQDMANYNLFMTNSPLKDYPKFSVFEGFDIVNLTTNIQKNGFNITATASFPINLTYSSTVELPVGPMWLGLNPSITYSEDTGVSTDPNSFNMYTGKNTHSEHIFRISKYKKYIPITLNQIADRIDLYNHSGINQHPTYRSNLVLNVDGLYEHKIDTNVFRNFSPDIKISFDGTEKIYTENDFNIVNDITASIMNYLNDYDALLIKIIAPIQQEGDSTTGRENYNILRLCTYQYDHDNYNYDHVYCTANWSQGFESYWGVFKMPRHNIRGNDQVLFIKIDSSDANGAFENIMNNILHIHGDDIKYTGSFFEALIGNVKSTISLNNNSEGKLEFSDSWVFNGKNMFNSNSRIELNDHNSKLFTISDNKYFSATIPPITLIRNSDDFYFNESSLNTNITSLLNTYVNNLEDRNREVTNEIQNYNADTIVKNDDYFNSDVYESFNSSYETFVNIFNNSYICDIPFGIQVQDTWNPDDDISTPTLYKQMLRLGVSDPTLII